MDSLKRFAIYSSWGIAAALIAGMLGAFHPLADSFSHFRLHLVVLALPFIPLLFITGAWVNGLALAATVVVSVGLLGQLFGGGASAADAREEGSGLRIVSLNLHHIYADADRVAAFIADADPDVIALQELSLEPPKVIRRLKKDYPHQLICRYRSSSAIAVLSRTPFAATGCQNDHRLAWATVERDGQEVTVASLHLRWPFPSPQAAQISGLSAAWSQLGTPLVLTGDFNAAPWSHAVQTVARNSGTKVVPGLRRSYTWGDNWLGSVMALPIDHVLVTPTLNVTNTVLGPRASSDHLPLIVDIEIPRF
ncbi:endonuclease/exonuclease/phosphatase family protein [Nisaea sediminum]|uniref:endonuclease/exonuclease/phosphatase family protein n=1 Tax=Nisaea sediminum TaxID=2775867 RepID=UPI001867151A|nr:endonuclease/exonuclease/phosphatase family protein [Nisaea sediminum]